MTKFAKDLAERVLWTAAAAALAVLAPALMDKVPAEYAVLVPVLAAAVSAAKGFVAKNVGDPESAGTVTLD